MPRPDLLSLTPDDLAVLTNRGTVKRAQRELESGEATFTLTETTDGEVIVDWSDQARCTLPAGKTVSDARCNCVATTICRHVVRSVLAYQSHHAAPVGEADAKAPPAVAQPWDPGLITDEILSQHYKKPAFAAAQARFAQGVLVDLVRSAKPTARFHQLACTLRFLVPGDIRYTHCDCAEAAPCSHVLLAVWSFRLLPADKPAGFIATQQDDPPVPAELLDQTETLLRELADTGIAGLAPTWKDRVRRLEPRFMEESLIWPWEILQELLHEADRHAAHDARFSPEHVASLVGEWLIRADAIRSGTRATPQLLIRGSSSDRSTDIGSARYIGLGCGVRIARGGVTLTAFMQDSDSGSVVAVSRDFNDPAKDSVDIPKPFHRLAETSVVRGLTLAGLGGGQLILQGGKRAADHRIVVGRAKASGTGQAYAWESLRAPVRVEDFGELRARLGALPPASLRPRYVAENLHVLPVAAVLGAKFIEATQTIDVLIRDIREEIALVRHPYVARGQEGSEALLQMLADASQRLLFVAGQVAQTASGLLIRPTTLVFEKDGVRRGIQPWVDRFVSKQIASARSAEDAVAHRADDRFRQELGALLGEVLLLGLGRADGPAARTWTALAQHGESIGYDRFVRPVRKLGDELTRKLSTTQWTSEAAAPILLQLSLLNRLAEDVT
jgi:hypothetical protein